MRICLLSREYPPDTGWGGIGAYTFQHAKALQQCGHQVEVIALTAAEIDNEPEPFNDGGVIVHRAPWNKLLQELGTIWISVPYSHYVLKCGLALWRKFLEVHSAQPFDVVEAPEHLAEALFPALTKVCPLVVRLHTPHSKFIAERYHNLTPSFDHNLVAILERMPILEADVLSSPSEDLADYVAQDCGAVRNNICIVRNPVDANRFHPHGPRAIPAGEHINVFFAGRLEERKGIKYLLGAVPAVLKAVPHARFIVVGADTMTGPAKTSVLESLKKQLAASGCAHAVQFVNHVPLDQMPDYYRSADICVVPSLYENAPYTVLEAMASGKPVVGSSAGGTKEYIVHNSTGLIVPPSDSEAIAAALIELISDETKRLQFGRNGRQRVMESFERSVIVRQAVGTYELARARFQSQDSLYRRPPEQSLRDFTNLLHSYHQNLCQLIYAHSFRFRLNTWLKLLRSRPRLAVARLVTSALSLIPFAAVRGLQQKLDEDIALRMEETARIDRDNLFRSLVTKIDVTRKEANSPVTASVGTSDKHESTADSAHNAAGRRYLTTKNR